MPHVSVDERAAGVIATQHLLELGHRRIGFVAGPLRFLPTRQKAAGREAVLLDAGLAADGSVAHAEFGVEGGRRAMRELLARGKNRPTAVICSSDLMAIGALKEAREAGLRVPDDLSVVGFDGTDAAAWTEPPLTTIEQPIADIAKAAVRTLRELIESPGAHPTVYFRPRLRVGGSTAAPPRE